MRKSMLLANVVILYCVWLFRSREWSLLTQEEKEEHGLKKDDDGEFW
jgi:hypothetical protein